MCPQNVLIQQISNAGFAQLFRVFSQTKSLMQLTLNGCAPLSDESELANLLTNSTSLRSLSLSGIKNISSQIIPCISRFQIKTFSTITNKHIISYQSVRMFCFRNFSHTRLVNSLQQQHNQFKFRRLQSHKRHHSFIKVKKFSFHGKLIFSAKIVQT